MIKLKSADALNHADVMLDSSATVLCPVCCNLMETESNCYSRHIFIA